MTNTSHTIADVERDTGLSKDTLRVWERRYGFPTPSRDAQGERRYDDEQLVRLRFVRRLIDAGHRPGAIVSLSLDELQKRLAPAVHTQATADRMSDAATAMSGHPGGEPLPAHLQLWLRLLRSHRMRELMAEMNQWLLSHGLASLIRDGVAPMNTLVGEAWLAGELAVFEEHLYTEVVLRVLRQAIGQVSGGVAASKPLVLLTTVPGEEHQLGLVMAESMLVLQGCETVSLGAQTPLADIARAASFCQADVVALSFSAAMPPRDARDAVEQLRTQLPASVEIWTGGQCTGLQRRPRTRQPIARHWHLDRLDDIAVMVARWRGAEG